MKIVNCSGNMEIPAELKALLSKLESASFADECRYKLSNYGRRFCCIFIRAEQYSKEGCWHVKDLSKLMDNISILEDQSKEIDCSWNK